MSQLHHTSLTLRTHLSGVVASLGECDPADFFATSRLVQQLSVLRGQIEKEQVAELLPLCNLALRMAEQLNKDGQLGPRQTLDAIDGMLEQVCGSLGVDRPAESSRPQPVLPAAPTTPDTPAAPARSESKPKAPAGQGLMLVSNKKLGELMVQLSMLTPAQVEQALSHQRMTGCRLGEALIQMRLLPKEVVESALRMQNTRKSQRDTWNGAR